ncbi:MAG: hypothetical protein HYY18_07985 [Planctomycetes bacterium]|nr:hypothetical protein [Planctomycetota bacterium]
MPPETISCAKPDCGFSFPAEPDPNGIVTCPKCGTVTEAAKPPATAPEAAVPATKSGAERAAADLATLRKFHEKARGEVDRLTRERGVWEAEKAALEKRVVEAIAARRGHEQAQADLERARRETERLLAEKAGLERQVAGAAALQVELEKALAEIERLKKELGELRSGEIESAGTAALPSAAAIGMMETREMAVLPDRSVPAPAAPPPQPPPQPSPQPPPQSSPQPRPSAPPVPRPPSSASPGERIRYVCEGCGRKLGAPPEFIGTFGTCRFCGHRGQVPAKSTR